MWISKERHEELLKYEEEIKRIATSVSRGAIIIDLKYVLMPKDIYDQFMSNMNTELENRNKIIDEAKDEILDLIAQRDYYKNKYGEILAEYLHDDKWWRYELWKN